MTDNTTATTAMTPTTATTMRGEAATDEAIIRVRDLVKEYAGRRSGLFGRGAPVRALDGISFDVARGERFGIVGESGSGKSTLLRLLAGLDRPTGGTIEIDGKDVGHQKDRDLMWLRERLQLVFQDPMGSLDPRMTVGQIIAEPLITQGHPDRKGRVAELLTAVGLAPEHADRHPHQFSGGQRQRISIARALAPKPDILIADEAVSALDVSVRAQVLNLIDELVDELGLTLVFVSHDLSVVRHMCTRLLVLHGGEIVETGPTEQIYEDPQQPYTQRLINAVPTLEKALAGVSVTELHGAEKTPGGEK